MTHVNTLYVGHNYLLYFISPKNTFNFFICEKKMTRSIDASTQDPYIIYNVLSCLWKNIPGANWAHKSPMHTSKPITIDGGYDDDGDDEYGDDEYGHLRFAKDE